MTTQAEAAKYREIYADSLILLLEDLKSPFYRVDVNTAERRLKPLWVNHYGSQLEALKGEVREYDASLTVPGIWESIRLWSEGRLLDYNPNDYRPTDQRQINEEICERLDAVYEGGDPFLNALLVLQDPDHYTALFIKAGIEATKAAEGTFKLKALAYKVADIANQTFPRRFPPAERSAIRPRFLKRFVGRIKRNYGRKEDI